MSKPLLFVDMEGTLFEKVIKSSIGNTAPSSWTALAEEIGPSCLQKEEESKAKWNAGDYKDYVAWMRDGVINFQDHALARAHHHSHLDTVAYHPGVREVFDTLDNSFITIIITGGFYYQAQRAQRELGIDQIFAACELLWEDEKLVGANLNNYDYEGKVHCMKQVMKKYGKQAKDCIFIGDGKNDRDLAQEVGASIAFNGAPELQELCTHSINQPDDALDFRAVLQYL
jgi:phosphoserine phosphatase